jgi:hypothetical protein
MSELNFPTKLIRLIKATLTIVTCCGNIQNDCSGTFETRQRLRQGDVLCKMLFNDVLEVIVWQSVAIDDKHFEVVKEFVYLGSLIIPTNDVSLEIQLRMQTANICSQAFTRPWSAQSYPAAVKRGCWTKGRRTNCSYLRGRFSERYEAQKWCLQEKVQPQDK